MPIFTEPRDLAELAEIDPDLPSGTEERFSGYGVMGLPFASGDILAFRRFPASSLGYGYTSVWHRSPGGRWTFWSDVAPEESCARFYGKAIHEAVVAPIHLRWTGPRTLHVAVGEGLLDWAIAVQSTAATLAVNAVGAMLGERVWRRPGALRALGAMAGRLLGAGRLTMEGCVPNGQYFTINPLQVWSVGASRAVLRGVRLGPPGPLSPQATLGGFAIPQRGIFALGRAFMEPFDPARHSAAVSCRVETVGA